MEACFKSICVYRLTRCTKCRQTPIVGSHWKEGLLCEECVCDDARAVELMNYWCACKVKYNPECTCVGVPVNNLRVLFDQKKGNLRVNC